MSDFFSFRIMITPFLIRVTFFIGLALIILAALLAPFNMGLVEGLVYGTLLLVVGPIVLRVYCELMIVVFSIHECLQDLRRHPASSNAEKLPPARPGLP